MLKVQSLLRSNFLMCVKIFENSLNLSVKYNKKKQKTKMVKCSNFIKIIFFSVQKSVKIRKICEQKKINLCYKIKKSESKNL